MSDQEERDTQLDNPAQQLFDLISGWRHTPPNTSVIEHRSDADGNWWARHSLAVELIDAVSERLAKMPRGCGPDQLYQGVVERLRQGVFVVDARSDDSPNGGRNHFRDEDLGTLQIIAGLWGSTGMADPVALQVIMDSVREVEDLIRDSDLDEETSVYLSSLLTHVQHAVNTVGINGAADVRALANQLIGALSSTFVGTHEEAKAAGIITKLMSATKKVAWMSVGAGAQALGGGTVQRALEAGGF